MHTRHMLYDTVIESVTFAKYMSVTIQGCKNAGKYAYFPCHWYLPAFMAFMANMVANMAYMVNSMDSYQI